MYCMHDNRHQREFTGTRRTAATLGLAPSNPLVHAGEGRAPAVLGADKGTKLGRKYSSSALRTLAGKNKSNVEQKFETVAGG